MIKKIMCMILALIMALTCSGIVSAAVNLSQSGSVRIEAENYVKNYDPTTINVEVQGSNPRYISFNAKEWVEYEIVAPKEGDYLMTIFTGIAPAVVSVSLEISVDEKIVLEPKIAATTGYMDIQPGIVGELHLTKGAHVLRIKNLSGGNHFDYFTLMDNTDKGTSNKQGPYREYALPNVSEAEDFDMGKNNIIALDDINSGGFYRIDSGIDVRKDASGYYVTLAKGEKVKYTFDVTIPDIYTMSINAKNPGKPAIYVDGMPAPIIKDVEPGETELASIYFPAGKHFIEVEPSVSQLVFDSIRFKSDSSREDFIMIDSLFETKEEVKEEKTYGVTFNDVYKELYVSANGSDDGDGSEAAPFKTIKRAKEETAKLSKDMTGDIIVNIGEGVYFLDETEIFSKEHGGKNGYNIVYRGTDKENQPIISGGVEITGWEKHNDKLWKAPADVEDMRNLYINDFPAIRARSKYTYVHQGVYDNPDTPSKYDGIYVDRNGFTDKFERPEDMELVWLLEWTSEFIPVEGIKLDETAPDKIAIELYEPMFKFLSLVTQPQLVVAPGKNFFIENAMELLDEPGEFYYNKEEKTVYYYPFERDDMENVKSYVGNVEQLVIIDGASTKDKIENITFDNLAFRHGAWNYATEHGFYSTQADAMNNIYAKDDEPTSYMPPAQIEVSEATNINFVNCDFACLGSTALKMSNGVNNSVVDGNLFRDLSGGAITIGDFDHGKAPAIFAQKDMELCDTIAFTNNVVRRVGGEFRSLVPISVYYEKNIDIIHNHIEDVPYTGITAGWGWGALGPEGWGKINISYNNVIDVMSSLRDGGNIYTLGPMKESTISHNYVSDSHYVIAGIYNDQGSGHINMFENVIDCEPGQYWWYQGITGTQELHAYDNFSRSDVYRDAKTGCTLDNHTILETADESAWPEKARKIKAEAGVLPEYEYLMEKGKAVDDKYCRVMRFPTKTFVTEAESAWTQAEDYRKGGQGIGYYKTKEIFGSAYRPEEGVSFMKSPSGVGYVIDNNYDGEWFAYEVEVPADGEYFLDLRGAHGWTDGKGAGVSFYVDNELVIDKYMLPKSPTWNDLLDHQIGKLNLKAGKHVVKLQVVENGFYIDAFRIHDGRGYETNYGTDAAYDEGVFVDEADLMKAEEETISNEGFVDCVGHWAENDINTMKMAGYVNGVTETEFAPNSLVTKKQAILLAMRVLMLNSDDNLWEEKAKEYGVYDGKENVDAPVSREEFAKIIVKLYEARKGSYRIQIGGKLYEDAGDIGAEFIQYVSGAKEEGLMSGDENGNFRPKASLSRAEAVVVARRLLK